MASFRDTFNLGPALGVEPRPSGLQPVGDGSMAFGDIFGAVVGAVGGGLLGGPVGAALGSTLGTSLFGGGGAAPALVAAPGTPDFVGPVPPQTPQAPGLSTADALAALLQQVGSTATMGAIPSPAVPVIQAVSGTGGALAAPGGNGSRFRTTFVMTRDTDTGRVLRVETLKGAPFLMNNDVRKLSTISRKVSKANSKIPRKTVRESATTQLKNAAVQSALTNVLATCPTKPC